MSHRASRSRLCGRRLPGSALRCLGVLLVLGALACAEGEPTFTAVAPWTNSDGYTPVVITVTAPEETTVDLGLDFDQASARTTLRVAARQPQRTTLLLPPTGNAFAGLLAWKDAAGAKGGFDVRPAHADRALALALVDSEEALPLKDWADVGSTWSSHHYSSSGTRAARVPREHLPQRWQGYPMWLTLAISASDDQRLDSEVRAAIATWVRAGGTLAVATAGQVAGWRTLGIEPFVLGRDADHLRQRIAELGGDQRPSEVPVPGTDRVPATGFMLVALLFAVVVGPLNLWWVRRRGARHLFLLTTPLISLATCAGLLVVDVLVEGLALRRTVAQFTLLDQGQGQALAWTRASYYGGFAVGAIALDGDSDVRRSDRDDESYGYYGSRPRRGGGRDDDFQAVWDAEGQRLTGSWIPARTVRQLLYRAPRPERARVTIERVGTGWRVTNGLATGIAELRWRDPAGGQWIGGAVPFGATVDLRPRRADEEPLAIPLDQIDGAGRRAWRARAAAPGGLEARLDGPLGAPSGPAGDDVEPPLAWLCTTVLPGAAP